MASAKFTIDGRPAGKDPLSQALADSILNSIEKKYQDLARAVVCPQHKQRASIAIKGSDLKHLSVSIDGCCQKLLDLVVTRFK